MSQPWNVGTPTPPADNSGGLGDPAGIGNALRDIYNSVTGGTPVGQSVANEVGDDIGSALADAFKGVAGPITAMFGIKEASLLNTLNELMNTAFYGVLALAGGLLCAWGLYEVGKDAGINVGEPVKAAAGVASAVLPVGRVAKATLGSRKVTGPSTPKVVKEAVRSEPKSDSGGREKAARDAGLGAAQILRGRREDAAAK